MKKVVVVLSILVVLTIVVTRLGLLNRRTQSSNAFLSPFSSVVSTASPEPDIAKPVTFEIPKLNINTKVENVAQDKEGRMDVPKDFKNVGWYEPGFKPGQNGSAVMAGHFDTATGAPAVFYKLTSLEVGDEIYITDSSNTKRKFIVTAKESYDYDKVPMQKVFGEQGRSQLNLITCAGEWDAGNKNYSRRTVIFSVLSS
jgi:LPXTG-site transpeptidase (sortase) family protein